MLDLAPNSGPLTMRLLHHIDSIPIRNSDLESAAWFVLDAIACIGGAQSAAPATPLLNWMYGSERSASRLAFAYGALSNILEMDAMHRASATHPGTVVVPAALAVASSTQPSGPAFLTAVLKGFEVAARIGKAAGTAHARLYQATATCCPFGAAACAGALLKLDQVKVAHAVANAGTRTGGLWQFVQDGSMSKQWHAGKAAEDGVVAAELAGAGLTGPLRILEGEKGFFSVMCPESAPDRVLEDGRSWQLNEVSYKPWPSPRHTHPAIDAALRLRDQIASRSIRSVEVDTYPVVLQLCNMRDPTSEHEARFSTAYCVAAALNAGVIDASSFTGPARALHMPLQSRIRVNSTERFTRAFPAAWGAEVRVLFADGSTATSAVEHTKGDPAAPMSEAERHSKAMDLLAEGGVENRYQLVEAVLNMQKKTSKYPASLLAAALPLSPPIERKWPHAL